ncbi:ubiquitin-conjugating enzyme [Trichophyton tonsurans CBS 112818]|uniref:Ubiquitin-conjugating enzyme n=1 Tax=Trichophyton tonsurans (strain CBS 112818) TaxID=647933 RepID=F2S6P8_TRIT1|nr:ubiquitin-conjugating enzyme [Trichophyton tonsurans CBS 112818]
MSSSKLPRVAALRRQQLRLEFASIKVSPPVGVYVSLSPSDPALWSGVLFVQKGPYASAILRFQIRFPPLYPDLPPLVTFTTPIFHPLVVPLTTQTYSNRPSDLDSVTGTIEEQLPPGGFSLRHGFPQWFIKTERSTVGSLSSSRSTSGQNPGNIGSHVEQDSGLVESSTDEIISRISSLPCDIRDPKKSDFTDVTALDLLEYIRSTFDDETVLDSIPLEATGCPNAWHAWSAHRRQPRTGPATERRSSKDAGVSSPSTLGRTLSPDSIQRSSPQARSPGEWNWEGVWLKRVKDNIHHSFLESVLFGSSSRAGSSGDDMIRFQKLDHSVLTNIKEEILTLQESQADPRPLA